MAPPPHRPKPESACTGGKHLSRPLHTHQSVPAHLTLEKGTCCVLRTSRPPRQPRPASVLPLLAPCKIHPCPKSLQDNVPLLVRHCTPQPIGWFPLNKGHHQTQCYIVLFLSFDTAMQKKRTITRVVEGVERLERYVLLVGM